VTTWRELLDPALTAALAYLDSLPDRPVWARAAYEDMVQAMDGPLPDDLADPAQVVATLAGLAEPGLAATPSGRFYGFVVGGTHPAALAADWLTSAWDQNAGLGAMAPAAAAAEAVAARWIIELLGLPAGTTVGFVTGGMMANFTGLGAARHAVLARAGWDVERRGLAGAPPLRIVAGADRHDTIDLAVRYLGIGTEAIVPVASDEQGRLRLDALEDALDGERPTIVCLQAGEVHTGAFDPLRAATDLAHAHGAWVHVDGAFGLWAAAAPSTRHLTDGVEKADSWATDAHKTLNVPYDIGLVCVRDATAHRAAFGVGGDYLITSESGDPFELVPEFSRRARGFPVWAVLQALGRRGVAELVEGLCAHARRFAGGVSAISGGEVLNDVVFTQVLTAFGDDAVTREVGRRVLTDGTAVMTPSTWRGRATLRASMSNWSTTNDDIDRSLSALGFIVDEVRTTSPG
jgi:glutamate/tyrosine decarboxylase-like PLP-dependent enzyme